MRIYRLFHNDYPLVGRDKNHLYFALGAAKTAAKNYVKLKNKRLPKNQKIHFEDMQIVEYDLVEKEIHPI